MLTTEPHELQRLGVVVVVSVALGIATLAAGLTGATVLGGVDTGEYLGAVLGVGCVSLFAISLDALGVSLVEGGGVSPTSRQSSASAGALLVTEPLLGFVGKK